jgi:hypothetical protein
MKCSLSVLVVAVLFSSAGLLRADEPLDVQLDFVRKLRTKHYSNLALEYLDKLKKSAPAEMGPLLTLEIARTKVSLAQEKEPEQRSALFAQARAELEAFIQGNGDRPEAAEARVEVARLSALQGKAQLAVAFRQDTREEQIAGAVKARQQFEDAGKELEAAAKQLEALQAKVAGAKTAKERRVKEKLEEAYLQVLLDRATNYLDSAETYIDESKDETIRNRSLEVEKAKKALGKIADIESTGPQITLARAWLVRCFQLTDAPQDATKHYRRVMAETGAGARSGQRLASYFHIQGIARDPGVKKDKNAEIIKEATAWLKNNSAHRNTSEGLGVRFQLAKAQLGEAAVMGKGATAAKLTTTAQKELAALATSDSEFASQANELNVAVSVERIKDVPLAKLADLNDCFLKAQYEMLLLKKAKDDDARKAHLKNVVADLKRALLVADGKADARQIPEVRYYLTFAYLMSGDPYRAAILGESIARSRSPSKRAPAAAGYALDAYAGVLNQRNGNTDGNRQRVRDLAEFVLINKGKVWKTDPVSTIARYQLAMVNLRERKYEETIDLLEQLPPDYSGYIFAQSQLALTAIKAAKDAPGDAERAAFQQRALKALRRIPTLPPQPDPATAQMFFAAQLEQGNLLYAAAVDNLQKGDVKKAVARFEEMDKFTKRLHQQFKKLDAKLLNEEVKGQLDQAMGRLTRLAEFGQANTEHRAGNYDKVLALTEGTFKDVKALDKGDNGPIVVKDYKVTGGLLGLYLRTLVQKGQVAQAKEVLPLLRRLQGDNDLENDAGLILQGLIKDLADQIKLLQERKDKAGLETIINNYSAFLEELSKQSNAKESLQNLFFIARCYGSLDKHDKAAELYGRIPYPKEGGTKKPDEKEIATYWYIQLQLAREHRLAKHFKDAEAVLGKIPPAFRSFPVQQEEIFQLEDQGLFGKAVTRWGGLMKNPHLQKKMATDNEAKRLYFDCFYHFIDCTYKYGKNHKVPAKQAEYISKAAQYILRLETSAGQEGWQQIGSRLRLLLHAEPPLRAAYEELSKKQHEVQKKATADSRN